MLPPRAELLLGLVALGVCAALLQAGLSQERFPPALALGALLGLAVALHGAYRVWHADPED